MRWPAVFVALALCWTQLPPALANCQLGGTACGDPVAIDCNGGAVCFPPWKACSGCTCTTTTTGKTCLASSAQPGIVSSLFVAKAPAPAGALNLSWGASCNVSAPDYAIYEGAVGTWYSHESLSCTSGGSLTSTVTPSGGSHYYLIAPISGSFTGSLGTSSAGIERPDAGAPCTDNRALVCP